MSNAEHDESKTGAAARSKGFGEHMITGALAISAIRMFGYAGFGFLTLGVSLGAVAEAAPRDLQSIVAVVNDEMVSDYDLEKRVSLVLAATGGRVSPEQRQALQKQALQNLIDEKLQLQEAAEFEVPVGDDEIDDTFARIGQQYNFAPAQFEAYLQSLGTTKAALVHQIKAELAWSKLVRGRLRSQITIGDEEVEAVLKRLEDSAGENEYLVSEIFLIVESPDQEPEVRRTATQLTEQLRAGASFVQVARQFSDAATAAVGGDMGWIAEGQLSPSIDQALQSMRPNDISEPLRTAGGYYVLELREKRQILTANPMDTLLGVYQMYFKVDGEATPGKMKALNTSVETSAASITSCENLDSQAEAMGADDKGDMGVLRLGDLSPTLQDVVKDMEPGQVTRPIDAKDGYRLLVICSREEPEVNMPTADAVMNSLSQQRLSMMARRYLRDLRRDAIIDYR